MKSLVSLRNILIDAWLDLDDPASRPRKSVVLMLGLAFVLPLFLCRFPVPTAIFVGTVFGIFVISRMYRGFRNRYYVRKYVKPVHRSSSEVTTHVVEHHFR